MKKILKFSLICSILCFLYQFLNIFLIEIMDMRTSSSWEIIMKCELLFLVLYTIIIIRINRSEINSILINKKRVLILSLCCTIGSSLFSYITLVILSLICYGFGSMREDIGWFNLFLLLWFIALFIIYFIIFFITYICYRNIRKRRD